MASREFEALLGSLPPGQPAYTDPPEQVREKMHAIHPTSCSEQTRVEWLELDGIPAVSIATPENLDSDRIVFHVHGGAFVSTELQHYLDYGEHLSRHARARVICFQYRWAPEHRFPAALEDTLTAYRALLAQGTPPERIAFVGDSCGGGIALAAACASRDAGDGLPACLVGLTPWLDAEQQGDAALHPRGRDPFVEAQWIRERFKDYVGPGGDLSNPLVSPIHADLAGLPPLYLSVGQIDTTSDDSTRLAERAGREGASLILDIAPEMIHGYVGLCGAFPEATEAMERVGAFIRQRIPDRATR
ncbi:MAG: alpha/beta hydrolase [bacterium]